MTVAFNTDTIDWFTAYRDQSLRMFELDFRDTQTGTPTKNLKLQCIGKVTQYGELAEREGQDIVKIKVVSEYDGTRDFRVRLANGVTGLT